MGDWTHSTEETNNDSLKENPPSASEENVSIEYLGSLEDLVKRLEGSVKMVNVDDMYVCLSRRDKHMIKKISRLCDQNMIRFFYVPVSVESIGLNLRREMIDDIEIYTTYENPLASPFNKMLKRAFDIVFSIAFLIPTAIIFPWIYFMIKRQSPGPILFKQERTGIDGKTFKCYKFRSMHVNKDADKLQATEHDPRKFPFGDFMRKANLDELPQFYNVLQGRMSIVGPRPHMLAHTEQYSQLIAKYMVRHYVKPGVTGWAQVTGFRGETKELWQMEERVKRDIWYIENWTIWLDFRIIWLTAKSIFIHDKNAY
jgi:putative colanic acid biosynthesis UDP-glucose lipid carrier transferase